MHTAYTYQYDYEGNITRRTNKSDNTYRQFTYDSRNRLTLVEDKTALGTTTQQVAYAYDANDRLVRRVAGLSGAWYTSSDQTYYHWHPLTDQVTQTTKVYFNSGSFTIAPQDHFLWMPSEAGPDQPLAGDHADYIWGQPGGLVHEGTYWALTDTQGTTLEVIDGDPAHTATFAAPLRERQPVLPSSVRGGRGSNIL